MPTELETIRSDISDMKVGIAEVKKDTTHIKNEVDKHFCDLDNHIKEYGKTKDVIKNNASFIKDLKENKKLLLQTKWWKIGVIMGVVYFVGNLINFWIMSFILKR